MARKTQASMLCSLQYSSEVQQLPKEEAGALFHALYAYTETGEQHTDELGVASGVLFRLMIKDIDSNKERYDEICERNRKNGSQHKGAKKTHVIPQEPTVAPTNPVEPTGTQWDPSEPDRTQWGPIERNGIEGNGMEEKGTGGSTPLPPSLPDGPIPETAKPAKRTQSAFVPPTVAEAAEYAATYAERYAQEHDGEHLPAFDADCFVNHYEANGWCVGKNKMRNWQAAVRNWILRDHREAQQHNRASPMQAQEQPEKPKLPSQALRDNPDSYKPPSYEDVQWMMTREEYDNMMASAQKYKTAAGQEAET